MPQAHNLTDAKLKKLYFGIAQHYKDCCERMPAMQLGDKLVSNFFTRSEKVQNSLDIVRKLRRGEVSEVHVGDLKFDCREDGVIRQHPLPNYIDDSLDSSQGLAA